MPSPVEEAREQVARIVYAAMQSVSEEGKRYPWQEGGNSTMQDIARRHADTILRAVRADTLAKVRGAVEGMPNLAVDTVRHPTLSGANVDLLHRSDVLAALTATRGSDATD